jgi:ribosomal protein S27E
MNSPTQVSCDICGQLADVSQNEHIDPSGNLIRWPKAATKPDGIYFAVECPKCGERYQLVSKRPSHSRARG